MDKRLLNYMTDDERERYGQFASLMSQLKPAHRPAVSMCFFKIGIYERGRDEPKDERKGLSHSFLRNYRNVYAAQFCGVNATNAVFNLGNVNVKAIDGTVYGAANCTISPVDLTTNNAFWSVAWHASFPDNGMMLGSGSAAEAESDFALANKINHGIAGGELFFCEGVRPAHVWDTVDRQWTGELKRHFWNRSGGNVTVAEMGVRVRVNRGYYTVGSNLIQQAANVFILRDVLTAPVIISDGEMAVGTYTFVSPVYPQV